MSECPTIERWEALACGLCAEDERDALGGHLSVCRACSEMFSIVTRNLELESVVGGALRESGSTVVRGGTPLGLVGRSFDGYTILRVLGSGGSATVYEARQESTARHVAIKVLSPSAVGSEHVRRFEQEARVMGRLRHPGVATVEGWGVVPDDAGSRPYIAMEFVDGLSITRHALEGPLGIPVRLDLIAQACEAVAYAHEQGVVHRDLKPANVLVTRNGSVRVLDFGFARSTDSGAGSQPILSTMHTSEGQIVGTVAYMSPEHTMGATLVDARSDVYALGVIAYEVLTGRHPYWIREQSLEAAVRTINEAEPIRPSRVLPELGGAVEIVLLRAIEKRPRDRYATAAEMAAEVRRLISGEAITTKRMSTLERWGKFARRHRGLVAGVATVILTLLVGLAGTSFGLVRAMERSRVAERRRVEAERLATLMEGMLRAAHPHEARGRGYTVRQMLDDFSARFAGSLDGQERVEASLRTTIGTGYRVLGEYALARPQLERALELRRGRASEGGVGGALCELGWLEHDEGRYVEAIVRFRQAVDVSEADADVRARATLGWSDCLRHSGDFAAARERAVFALEEASRAESAAAGRIGPERSGSLLADAHLNRSRIERDAGDYEVANRELGEAMRLLRRGVDADDPRLADALNDEAWLAYLRRDLKGAERAAREAMEVGLRTLGPGHPDIGNTLYELGMIVASRDETDEEAERILREAVSLFEAAHGENHPSTFTAREALSRVIRGLGKSAEAREILERVLVGRRAFFGERNVEVAYGLSALAQVQRDLDDLAGAEASSREAIDIYNEAYRGPHPFIANAQRTLAGVLQLRGDPMGAREAMEAAVATSEASLGPDHADTLGTMQAMGRLLESQGAWENAERVFATVVTRAKSGSAMHANALHGSGRCLIELGRWEGASKAMRGAIAEMEALERSGTISPDRVLQARGDLERAVRGRANGG